MGPTLDALAEIDGALTERLRAVVARATRSHVRLPPIRGVPHSIVARLVHRAAVEASVWGPLVQIDAIASASPTDLADALAVAEGGWIHASVDPSALDPRRVRCMVDAVDTVPIDASPEGISALLRWDPHHAVAADPALGRVRDVLLAHCRRGEVVLIEGPAGSGRRALARWAQATLQGDRWLLFSDLEQFDRSAAGPLLHRLRSPTPAPVGRPHPGHRPDHEALIGIVGTDPGLCAALAVAARHAKSREPLLVTGESGTGKEPLARAVHAMSGRRGPLVAVDLSSRPAALVADDLFGRVSGAYSDARESREGAFRRADRGTLFLDELGNLSLDTQAQLLRVLETGDVQPLGTDRTFHVDVRVIAATNADLNAMALAGRFRPDLLHRLGRSLVRLPPLRERPGDLEPLALHFLGMAGRSDESVDCDVLRTLRAHSWPGNVRELRSVMTWAATEAGHAPLRPEHLGPLTSTEAVLVTAERVEGTALTAREQHSLRAVCVRIEGPAARGPASVRNAVLTALAGRLVRPDALRMLERWPWWGHFVELERKMQVLQGTAPQPIDAAMLTRLFPELGATPRCDPIVVLLHPSLDSTGQVVGMRSIHTEAGVVLGRVGSRAEARVGVAEATAWVDDVLDTAGAAWLALPHLPYLSRIHVLVSRTSTGLCARIAPEATLEVWAGPLDEAATPLSSDVPTPLADAGRIVVLRENEPYVEVVVALGAEALLRVARHLASARHPRAPATTLRDDRGSRRVWRLDREEVEALTDMVLGFLDAREPFSTHISAALRDEVRPTLQRLKNYLAAHPTAYCGRLYDHPANSHLRAELSRRVTQAGREELARERLPAAIARIVTTPHLVLAEPGDR